MLQVPAEFPHTGCTAFLRGTAAEVRLLQRNADGTCLVQRLGQISRSEGASIERRVPFRDLFATGIEALGKSALKRQRSQVAEGDRAKVRGRAAKTRSARR